VVSLRSISFRSSCQLALGKIEKLLLEEIENGLGTIKHPHSKNVRGRLSFDLPSSLLRASKHLAAHRDWIGFILD
jgi:hypothetical protein